MNTYFCTDCGKPADPPHCPHCGSYRVHISGDLHLRAMGLDVYLNLARDYSGVSFLVIKKPSGQFWLELQDMDFLKPPEDDRSTGEENDAEWELEQKAIATLAELEEMDKDYANWLVDQYTPEPNTYAPPDPYE